MRMTTSFQLHKALSQSQFEQQQKDKDYSRFMHRVDNIVQRKPCLDTSSDFYMRSLGKYKQMANRMKRGQSLTCIDYQNQILMQKLASIQKRKPEKNVQYEVRYYVGRKKQMERINKQNEGIAARLAEKYAGTGKHSLFSSTDKKKENKKSDSPKRIYRQESILPRLHSEQPSM